MVINLDKYRVNVPAVKVWMENRPDRDPIETLGELAVATNVPLIVIVYYAGELFGFSEELKQFSERIKEFYGIKDVLGYRGDVKCSDLK
jgi:hypothetical protein